jgi:uncharacterized protein YbjT (DUF2867 family)
VRFEDVTRLLAALDQHGVRYVMIGSMAMATHGVVRATQDVDFFVDPGADNVARLRAALHSLFDDESIEEITSDDLAGEYPVVRYGPPTGGGVIDLVGRLGERFSYDDIESQVMEIDGVPVAVATPRMLYEMKRDTLRPQDRADAEALRNRFDLED